MHTIPALTDNIHRYFSSSHLVIEENYSIEGDTPTKKDIRYYDGIYDGGTKKGNLSTGIEPMEADWRIYASAN